MSAQFLTLSGAFDRSAIMSAAWASARAMIIPPRPIRGFKPTPRPTLRAAFKQALRRIWDLARGHRACELARAERVTQTVTIAALPAAERAVAETARISVIRPHAFMAWCSVSSAIATTCASSVKSDTMISTSALASGPSIWNFAVKMSVGLDPLQAQQPAGPVGPVSFLIVVRHVVSLLLAAASQKPRRRRATGGGKRATAGEGASSDIAAEARDIVRRAVGDATGLTIKAQVRQAARNLDFPAESWRPREAFYGRAGGAVPRGGSAKTSALRRARRGWSSASPRCADGSPAEGRGRGT